MNGTGVGRLGFIFGGGGLLGKQEGMVWFMVTESLERIFVGVIF